MSRSLRAWRHWHRSPRVQPLGEKKNGQRSVEVPSAVSSRRRTSSKPFSLSNANICMPRGATHRSAVDIRLVIWRKMVNCPTPQAELVYAHRAVRSIFIIRHDSGTKCIDIYTVKYFITNHCSVNQPIKNNIFEIILK